MATLHSRRRTRPRAPQILPTSQSPCRLEHLLPLFHSLTTPSLKRVAFRPPLSLPFASARPRHLCSWLKSPNASRSCFPHSLISLSSSASSRRCIRRRSSNLNFIQRKALRSTQSAHVQVAEAGVVREGGKCTFNHLCELPLGRSCLTFGSDLRPFPLFYPFHGPLVNDEVGWHGLTRWRRRSSGLIHTKARVAIRYPFLS